MSDRLPQPVHALEAIGVERASATPVVTLRGALPRAGVSTATAPETLAEVQRWMRAAIAGDADADLGLASAVLTAGPRLSAEDRLEIYRAGYHARLAECLLDDYPVLATLLGEARFHALSHDYVARYPSASPSLNRFSRHMAALCRDTPALDGLRVAAAELAELEWAIVEVLHAPAAERLDLSAFAALPPDAWAGARLVASDAVRLLSFTHPVNAYFQAVREGETPPAPTPAESTTVVYRSDLSVWRMDLTPAMTRVLEALLAGNPLGDALAAMAVDEEDEHALAEAERSVMFWFREWVSGGLFARVVLEG